MTNVLLILAVMVALFVCVFIACYNSLIFLRDNNIIKKGILSIQESSEQSVKEMINEATKKEMLEGQTVKESKLMKLEKMLIYSGLKDKFPFLNAVTYILINMVCALVIFAIVQNIFGNLLGLAAAALVIIIFLVLINLLQDRNYKKVEDNVVTFVNLIESFSKTDNDILNILNKAAPYLKDPLKREVEDAYFVGKRTGDIDLALNNLQKNVEHRKFKQIIRSLITCSHYEANYEDIIDDSRSSLMEYLKGKKELQEIAKSAKMEMIMLVGVSILVFKMMGGFLSRPIMEVLMGDFIGQCILIVVAILLIIILYQVLFMGKKRD